MLVMVILSLGLFQAKTKDDFVNDVNEAYEKYTYLINVSKSEYSFVITKGICNNEEVYGFYFHTTEANKYRAAITVKKESEWVILKYNIRGDICIVATSSSEIESILASVYLAGDTDTRFESINVTSEDSFAYDINGNNKGTTIKEIHSFYLSPITIYMLVCGGVILACGVIVLIFFKLKKGMFDKKIRQEGVFNFKEFLNSNIEEAPQKEVDVDNIIDLKEDDYEVSREEEESKEVYDKVKDDFFYSDEASGFDIKGYLKDKGFVLEYKAINDDEKNQIMMELIKLKNERKITNDEYLEEVYELWKK